MKRFADSLLNLVTGLGTAKDKSISTRYNFVPIAMDQLDAAYRGDWIARKVIDIPAYDATRQWRSWQAKNNQIEDIEVEERRHGVQQKLAHAIVRARLYGGAAIFIGVGNEDPATELDPSSVRRGALRYIHVLNRNRISAGQIVRDITSPYYGEPEYYTLSSDAAGTVRVHPSRVVRINGADLPDPELSADGFGDSVLQAVNDAIMQAGTMNANIAQLAHEAKVDIIRIPELMMSLATQEYRDRLTERFTLANVQKSINNTLMLDKDEEWSQRQVNFSGLPDMVRIYLMIATAAADIPATRFLGQSPAGLSSTGESDIRNYYDRVASDQAMKLTPAMARLDDVIVASALGSRPSEIHYRWNSLWQMTDKEKAEIAKLKADTWQVDVSQGLMPDYALQKGRENQLIEDGTYPGFEAALEEADNMPEDPDPEPIVVAAPVAIDPNAVPTTDAAPRTLYVRRDVVNAAEIRAWAESQGLTDIVDDMHVTIAYSSTPIDWIKAGNADEWRGEKNDVLTIPEGGPRAVEPLGGMAAVLMFASQRLAWRHETIIAAGASHEFPDYQPHVSLTKTAIDLSAVVPYRGAIVLGPEIFEEIRA